MKTSNSNLSKEKNFISLKMILGITVLCTIGCIALNIINVIRLVSPNGLGLSDEMIKYESPNGQYSMLASTKWSIIDLSSDRLRNTDMKTYIGGPFGSLEINVSSKHFESTLMDDVISWGKTNTIDNSANYKEIKTSEFSSQKRIGILNEYSRGVISPFVGFYWNSKTMHCLDYYFLEKEYGYSFSFCSVEKVWGNAEGLFMKMINSIEIK